MKSKLVFIVSALLIGTLLAACGPLTPQTINVQPQPPQRTITVTGTGKVTLTPDIAYISIGVNTQNASAKDAVAQNTTQAQAIIDVIKKAGIEAKDIQTTDFSIYPQQQYDNTGKLTGIIYVVNNSVYVTARDLTKLGDLLDAVVQSGANNINNITFDVADKTEALSQARKAAVAEAAKQAGELTQATGVSLGDVQTISYSDSTPPIVMPLARAADLAAGSSVPIQSGSMQISTTVTIVYNLK